MSARALQRMAHATFKSNDLHILSNIVSRSFANTPGPGGKTPTTRSSTPTPAKTPTGSGRLSASQNKGDYNVNIHRNSSKSKFQTSETTKQNLVSQTQTRTETTVSNSNADKNEQKRNIKSNNTEKAKKTFDINIKTPKVSDLNSQNLKAKDFDQLNQKLKDTKQAEIRFRELFDSKKPLVGSFDKEKMKKSSIVANYEMCGNNTDPQALPDANKQTYVGPFNSDIVKSITPKVEKIPSKSDIKTPISPKSHKRHSTNQSNTEKFAKIQSKTAETVKPRIKDIPPSDCQMVPSPDLKSMKIGKLKPGRVKFLFQSGDPDTSGPRRIRKVFADRASEKPIPLQCLQKVDDPLNVNLGKRQVESQFTHQISGDTTTCKPN